MNELDRRTVLRGAGAAGALAVAGPLLVACGPGADGGSTSGGTVGGGSVTVATRDVPVNGGVITDEVVVTQPESGTFRAFSAICTHQSCTVSSVESNVINCVCHESQFSASDGSVIRGPATVALPAKTATVSGDSVVVS